MRWHIRPRVLMVVGLLAMATACSAPRGYDVVAAPPLKTLFYFGDHLSIRLADGVRVTEIVDLTLFGQLKPGMTANAARATVGPPSAMQEREHVTYYRYLLPKAAVELSYEPVDYSPVTEQHTWRLRAFPIEGIPVIFHTRVAALLGPHLRSLRIFSADEELKCELKGSRVTSLIWSANE